LLNGLLVRALLPWLVPVLVAQQAASMQFGLLNHWALPLWFHVVITLLLLDLLVYWQHRLFHNMPLL